MTSTSEPICVIGAGPAGCSIAIFLARQGWPIRLLEAGDWSAASSDKSHRTLALAQSSWDILSQIGIEKTQMGASPIRDIHVSQRGMPGQVVLAPQENEPAALGHTVSYQTLLQTLRTLVETEPLIAVTPHCRVQSIQGTTASAKINHAHIASLGHTTLTPLAIVADGGAHIEDPHALSWSYGTEALSCFITSQGATSGRAWERFTREGPIALLPSSQGLSLIWTGSSKRIHSLCALEEAEFLAALQEWFGDRAGQFTHASPRLRYPLKARFSLRPAQHRVVRIANAAQNLHPVAGQGFNLGLRDVIQLTQCLGPAIHQDPGLASTLKQFTDLRRKDRWLTGGLTHLLAHGFTLPFPGIRSMGSIALSMMDVSPAFKNHFARVMSDGMTA